MSPFATYRARRRVKAVKVDRDRQPENENCLVMPECKGYIYSMLSGHRVKWREFSANPRVCRRRGDTLFRDIAM